MITDSISDLIIRIKNASFARKSSISIRHSNLLENISHTLKKAGYLSSVEKKKDGPFVTLELGLVYFGKEPRVHDVERISKPSRRIYVRASDLRTVRSGFGNAIISTPKGILVDVEAKKQKVGGEVLFKIW